MTEPRSPSLPEVMSQVLDESAAQISVCQPGEVVSWNRANQFVGVRPITLKADGSRRPVTIRTPVVFPGAYWDIQIGETGLLVMADEDFKTWYRTGETSTPESIAIHELSSAFFLPGVRHLANVRDLNINSAVLTRPAVGGTVRLGTYNASKAAVHEDLLGDLRAFLVALDTWGAAVGAATLVPWGPPTGPQTTLQIITAAILALGYQSPSVLVED